MINDNEEIKEDSGGVAPSPVNAMGASSSTAGTGGVDIYDKLLKPKKKLRAILRRRQPGGVK